MSGEGLNQRLAAALTKPATSGQLAELLAEVEAEEAGIGRRRAQAEAASLDPLTGADEADKAEAETVRLATEARRLAAARERLLDHHDETVAAERDAERRIAYAAAAAERDAIIALLETRYPKLVDELVGLLDRLQANAAHVSAVNQALPAGAEHLRDAEWTLRGVAPHESNHLGQRTMLASLDPHKGYLWCRGRAA